MLYGQRLLVLFGTESNGSGALPRRNARRTTSFVQKSHDRHFANYKQIPLGVAACIGHMIEDVINTAPTRHGAHPQSGGDDLLPLGGEEAVPGIRLQSSWPSAYRTTFQVVIALLLINDTCPGLRLDLISVATCPSGAASAHSDVL